MNAKTPIMLVLTMFSVLMLCGTVSAGTPLQENQTGTVTGDLYYNASDYWSQTTQGSTNEVTQNNNIPTYTNIQSAKVYVNVYSGSGVNNWPVRTTVKFDGNGDGDYDDLGELLGVEDMNIQSSTDGTVYWLNDHCNKVYSDYQVWYDVTSLITSNNPSLYVKTESMGGDGYDGRIKLLALVAAYNDGDSDQVHYWVLNGQDWINADTSPSTSTFNTIGFTGQVSTATLNTVALSSTDGTYNFNSNDKTGNLTETGSYYKEHTWDVTSDITPCANSTLQYTNIGGSFKLNLATLTIHEAAAPNVDLSITGTVNTVPSTAAFAKTTNNITIPGIKNNGVDTANNIIVALFASDVSDTTPVATDTISSLAGGASITINLIDHTIRDLEGGTVTYTVKLDPDNLIAETDETNNVKASTAKPLRYNGYYNKNYWASGGDITTKHTYDIRGDIIYYTQPESAYKGVGWANRTETWTAADLPIPATGTIEDVWLYLVYNWDWTADGDPNWEISYNGNNITDSYLAWYTDKSNFGSYANYRYGLLVFNVTSIFNRNGDNTLYMAGLTGNNVALYPSTLAAIYSDPTSTRKQIFINEEADTLAYSQSLYGTTMDNATAYAPFTELSIDLAQVKNATFHGFVGSAGPNEGNLLWNGALIASTAWQGTANTASALIFDVLSYLGTSNTAGIQATQSGGMTPYHQFLVVEYDDADLIVTNIKANVGAGEFMFANEPNVISVTVKNNGTLASQATTLDVDVNGTIYTVNVPALDAGASTTITITDTASHTGGSSVPVSANANPDRNIPETNTSNNTLNVNLIVYNNGYKGKQYTDDDGYDSIDTKQTFDGKYDVIYSNGDAAYRGSGNTWANPYTASWNSTDLPIPADATVVSARLYQGYTWNTLGGIPDFVASFNDNTLTVLAHYSDTKGFGTSNYPSGLLVYDVTSFFNTNGNNLTLTNGTTIGATTALYGSYLIVVYQDPNTTNKKIYINDGADMLCSRETFSVNDTEATAHANFNDVNADIVTNAQVIAILASANEEDKSKFFFNGQEYTGFGNDYLNDPQMGFSVYDVTSTMINGLNVAGLQSYDIIPGNTTIYGDNMFAMGSILITTIPDSTAPTVNASPLGGLYKSNQTVAITATDDQDPNPKIYYTLDGTTPTAESTLYTGPILISGATLKFIAVDSSGNTSPVQTETYTIDTIVPIITSIDPANNAVKVSAGKTIKVTFSENIKASSMWIELKNSAGKAIPFEPSVSGKVLTVDPISNLAESRYTLCIHTWAVTDLAGNPVALKTTRFSTGTSPTVTKVDPANGATKVAAGKTIKVTFNENIKKSSDWIELKNSAGKAIPFKSSVSGKVLTVDPISNLAESRYTLCIHTWAVTDLAGNPVALKTTRFSTGTSPTVTKVDPANGAIRVARNKAIKITFNENIKKGSEWIELKASNVNPVTIYKSISGKVLTISHALLKANTRYTLILHTGAVTDQAGNPVAMRTFTFTTGRT